MASSAWAGGTDDGVVLIALPFSLNTTARPRLAHLRLSTTRDLGYRERTNAHRGTLGLDQAVSAHQLRHAFASNVLDAGGGVDAAQELLGHATLSATQVYARPDSARLRAAVDLVPSPREQAGSHR